MYNKHFEIFRQNPLQEINAVQMCLNDEPSWTDIYVKYNYYFNNIKRTFLRWNLSLSHKK